MEPPERLKLITALLDMGRKNHLKRMVMAAATDHNTRVANQRSKTIKKGQPKHEKARFRHDSPY